METTNRLALPVIAAAQAQKHVIHNEALEVLDAIVHLSIQDSLVAPPAEPSEGARFLVASDATGSWLGRETQIALWQHEAWQFFAPRNGWLAFDETAKVLLVFDEGEWTPAASGGGSIENADMIGVNAAPDSTNRFAVSSPATLFNHEGHGHQMKLNKAASGDTASLLYQTGWSGRAEMGLAGDDNFHIKVSPDGTVFHEAMIIDRNSGAVSFPNSNIGAGGGGAPLVWANCTNPGGQSIPAQTHTPVTGWTLASGSMADTVLSNGVFTIGAQGAGKLLISASVIVQNSAVSVIVRVRKNGSAVVAYSQAGSGGALYSAATATGVAAFAAGDTFTVEVWQSATTAVAINLVSAMSFVKLA